VVGKRLALSSAMLAAAAGTAHAQSASVEVSQSAGYSSDDIAGAATQLRGFGDLVAGTHYFAEAAWGTRSRSGTDVFGAAYPYGDRIQVVEAFVERTFDGDGRVVSIRGGRYRTPFGIAAGSDHAYVGFLRPPLIRYDGYFALSNDFLEHGADVVAGAGRLSLEASVGVPGDIGDARRRDGVDAVVRVQAVVSSIIIGASRIRMNPYQPAIYAHGHATFTGVDARWMRDGVQLRGEWIAGRPFDGTTTTGGYVDLLVHRPAMGPLTAVARAERLAYQAGGPFDIYTSRYSGGVRIRVFEPVAASIGIAHQPDRLSQRRATALDVGVTCTLRRRLVER